MLRPFMEEQRPAGRGGHPKDQPKHTKVQPSVTLIACSGFHCPLGILQCTLSPGDSPLPRMTPHTSLLAEAGSRGDTI